MYMCARYRTRPSGRNDPTIPRTRNKAERRAPIKRKRCGNIKRVSSPKGQSHSQASDIRTKISTTTWLTHTILVQNYLIILCCYFETIRHQTALFYLLSL